MIYLDNAATSFPKPPSVLEAICQTITARGGNPGRGGHQLSLAAAEVIYKTRQAVATFLNAKGEEHIVFTQNATHAINTILFARATPNCHIIISCMEHNSVRRPVLQLVREGLATCSVFSPAGDILDNIRACLKPSDNILICSHVSNVNGYEFPVAKIARWCQENKVFFILDASQSLGHMPFDLEVVPCDALCAPGHKGLLGMQGSGILYIRDMDGLKQVFSGGSGADSLSPLMPAYLPDRFEAGTLSTPAIASLEAGIAFLNQVGLREIEKHEKAISLFLHHHLSLMQGIKLYSSPKSSIVAFSVDGMGSEGVATQLDAYDICVRGGHHCAPLAHMTLGTIEGGIVRVSPGISNTHEEAEVFLDCMECILKEKG